MIPAPPARVAHSAPVRVAMARDQRQLDVYGELLGAAHRLADQVGEFDEVTRHFLVAAVETAASRWTAKDQGIWETAANHATSCTRS